VLQFIVDKEESRGNNTLEYNPSLIHSAVSKGSGRSYGNTSRTWKIEECLSKDTRRLQYSGSSSGVSSVDAPPKASARVFTFGSV
jgi:hypothetical protein